jgi:hypothetical protein
MVIVTESGSSAEVVARLVTDGTPIVSLMGGDPVKLGLVAGAVALCVGIRCGAVSSDMKLPCQAARSIG